MSFKRFGHSFLWDLFEELHLEHWLKKHQHFLQSSWLLDISVQSFFPCIWFALFALQKKILVNFVTDSILTKLIIKLSLYRNQSIDLVFKSITWFLYDGNFIFKDSRKLRSESYNVVLNFYLECHMFYNVTFSPLYMLITQKIIYLLISITCVFHLFQL